MVFHDTFLVCYILGVIGAGIGGSSAVFYLREAFGSSVSIDVFENGQIGGRLATVEVLGKEFESGGSIIHPANLYMQNFTALLGLFS